MHTPSESGRSRATQLLQSKMVLNLRPSSTTTGTDPTRDVWGRAGGRGGLERLWCKGRIALVMSSYRDCWSGLALVNVPGNMKRAVKLVNFYNMQQLHN